MTIQWTTGKPRQVEAALKKQLADSVFALAEEVHTNVILFTPVQTGELRASWNLSANKPNFKTVGPRKGVSKDRVTVPPHRKAKQVKGAYKYYVSNGKRYVQAVEHGTPKMAPRHMLRRAKALAKFGS